MDDNVMEDFKNQVDAVQSQADMIEKKVHEIEHFYSNSKKQANSSKGGSASKDKDKDKERKKQPQDTTSKEGTASKRMQELIRQFGKILHQITQHKWAWPFMDPVDVEGLGLHDYYEIIKNPMDFSTIKKRMEAKDVSSYKHVREVCADVRLVFKNAMKYNDEKNDFHVMARTLLDKFEEKWLQFLPKVTEEEKKLEEEDAEAQLNIQLAQEAAYAKMARDISSELYEADMHLDQLREQLVQRCRKMSTEEKRQLSIALTRLSTDDLSRALDIVAQSNPEFTANTEEVDLDIDAQSESTLWRLKVFVKDALQTQSQGKPSASPGGVDNNENKNNNNNNVNSTSKRKREICDALAKTAKKKSKKVP
ncbi:transcription factor GTE1 isoform X1 [Amaranthus tricolor]|uniref:transcription factor GTE1 isoform X1 n=2 Tax=Amaranthus tricolor TaxID=29722 RepID=UPI00258627B3|nr:transcription factor GTE1 isoform X1 [Amaranthus tricolor]